MKKDQARPGGAGDGRFNLRPMMLFDLDQVLAIETESFREPWTRENFAKELMARGDSELTVAVEGEAVLGYSVVWFVEEEVHLANVAVRRSSREQGLGRTLVEAVVCRAESLGALRIVLEVRKSNVEAQNLYETLGFRAVGSIRDYYKVEKEDAVVMELLLEDGAGP